MARKTALDKFSAAVGGILARYGEEIQDNLADIVTEMGKKGAQAMRDQSRQALGGSGEYAKGWKVQIDRQRLSAGAVIYNEHAGLPHLLEHGHVTRNGTGRTYPRTPGHEHIAPVEEQLVETFEREVRSKL